MQSAEELRLPVDSAEVQHAVVAAYEAAGSWRGEPELLLELRASLTAATSWAPMVRLPPCVHLSIQCLASMAIQA